MLQAIKTDDVYAYDGLAETTRIWKYRLGRFPVLSLLYLYNARKIIAAHEDALLTVSDYVQRPEPVEISRRFSAAAGKCLRLYRDEIVSPLEMLLILDKAKHLTRVFPSVRATKEIRSRLQAIYSIKYALSVRFEGENIFIDKRPLSYREKKKIITASVCAAAVAAVAVCVPIVTVSLMPHTVDGEVYKLGDIDFASKKEYVLKRDIVLDKTVDAVNCSIDGNGHKLIFGSGAAFGTFNGTLTGATVESTGSAVFYTVSRGARIADVTVNVQAYVLTDADTALVATYNYGEFDGVTVNVRGIADAADPDAGTTAELTLGGMVMTNCSMLDNATHNVEYGVIKNSAVNYFGFELGGEVGANAAFGGIVGVNNGVVLDCTVSGGINADTVDVAGVCVVNNGELNGCVNNADIAQASAQSEWNPIACGIVMNNSYLVRGCENTGKISAASDSELESENERSVVAAGIAYLNNNTANSVSYLVNCTNSGDVESSAALGAAYAAGVCMSSTGGIEHCVNDGAVSASTENGGEAAAGGIADRAYGYIYKSKNSGNMSAVGSDAAYVGGISAVMRAQCLNCVSGGNITATAKNVYAGGIFGRSDVDNYGKGTAEFCISSNRLDVAVADGGFAYVGGIAGFVTEQPFTGNGTTVYFGGGVTDSCFVGEYVYVKSGVYFGNIVGVCGANIYATNSYYSDDVEHHYFDGNYYVNNSFTAFGATLSADAASLTHNVGDKGATFMSIDDVKKTETYKKILSEIEKA